MMLSDVSPPAAPLTEEAQGKHLAAFLFRNVVSQRFAHQRGQGNTFPARQCAEILLHGFFYKQCGALHMTYSSIQGTPLAPAPPGEL